MIISYSLPAGVQLQNWTQRVGVILPGLFEQRLNGEFFLRVPPMRHGVLVTKLAEELVSLLTAEHTNPTEAEELETVLIQLDAKHAVLRAKHDAGMLLSARERLEKLLHDLSSQVD